MERPNLLLTGSALLYLLSAIALLFASEELLHLAAGSASQLEIALLQLVGAGLLGFAMLNWLSRYSLTGGIYGRPLVVANLAHTATAALTIGHFVTRPPVSPWLVAATLAYAALGAAFGAKLFLHPSR